MAENRIQDLSEQEQIRRDKLASLQEAGKDPFQIRKYEVTHHGAEIREGFDSLEGREVSVAGRMMTRRIMGKASFCHVQDLSGEIQAYVARDLIGEESTQNSKRMISATSSASGEPFSGRRWARFPYTRNPSRCCPNP